MAPSTTETAEMTYRIIRRREVEVTAVAHAGEKAVAIMSADGQKMRIGFGATWEAAEANAAAQM